MCHGVLMQLIVLLTQSSDGVFVEGIEFVQCEGGLIQTCHAVRAVAYSDAAYRAPGGLGMGLGLGPL